MPMQFIMADWQKGQRRELCSGLASGCPKGLWCSRKLEVSSQELWFQ